ncbi:alcohol dehydrogenase catalytic domain-containing protein [Mycobacterium sp. 21AC1]|uniref:alcohol dehydrogenase catalytic domain-containing protein n=1 Tax=[Mycobacterium] appelbergii TaxID=2939269 RepID=UPI0029394566|nr:alcohol dehydrogenase catalytic domain-containing protein [Mycobacterium sp. 21AC1]MDV3126144.1 alcohol dehydrogenase catalytic domain-containing protein [Mycobacterium sp. 21AC1]
MIAKGAVLNSVHNQQPFAEHRPLTVCDIEIGDPQPGELLVKMEAAGLCHSDLSRVNGDRVGVAPVVLGHEGCGRVVAVGGGVDDITIGDKVALVFHTRCGECDACTGARWSLCPTGLSTAASGELLRGGRRLRLDGQEISHHAGASVFAEYAVVDRRTAVIIPDAIPSPVGALLGCALLTGGGAVLNAGQVAASDDVAVVGLGGVGLAAAMVAAGRGARVTAIDLLEAKLDMALSVGAHHTMTPDQAHACGHKFDVVIEAVGRTQALEAAVTLTRVGGRTVTVGLPHPSAQISVSAAALVLEARSLVGSYLGSGDPAADIAEYAEMYLRGDLPVDKLISQHIHLDDLNEALDSLTAGEVARQVVVFDH